MLPAEAEAMRLVSKHTSVPVPEVLNKNFRPDWGLILMTLVPGSCLKERWDGLSDEAKNFVCCQIWDFISKIRNIPRPPELEGLFQCLADGSITKDAMLENLQNPGRPLKN